MRQMSKKNFLFIIHKKSICLVFKMQTSLWQTSKISWSVKKRQWCKNVALNQMFKINDWLLFYWDQYISIYYNNLVFLLQLQ